MKVAVLGPVEVVDADEPVDAGAPKQRAVLAALALHRPRAVAVDALVDLLWGDHPPPSPLSSLHGYIAGLRRVVEPGRAARGRPSVLVTVPPGYALRLADDDVDADRFAATVDAAHRRLTPGNGDLPRVPEGLDRAELDAIASRLSGALALWRGTPYLELDEAEAAVAERARLAELRLVAIEDLALVRLELGEPATVAAALEAEARRHPLRERLWALLALALGRAGRQAEAIDALQAIRRVLADELGVDPGATLRAVELAVLRQDLPTTHTPDPAPRERPTAADPRDWPLAGRDAELAALTGLLAEARAGHTRFALLTGEPGIGKSRLTAELARHATGFAVLTGRCSEDEGAPPFWPWTGVLRDLAAALGPGTVRELAGPDADVLPGVTGPAVKPVSVDAERFRVFDAVARLLTAAAARTPLLVVLDDLHWADPSSLRLVRHLTEHLPETRLVLAVTRRLHPEPAGALAEAGVGLVRRQALRLDLTGLSVDGVGALMRTVTGAADEAAALRERTDGNPFFLVELLRFEKGAGDIPAAVTDVLARRVARLPAATGELLRCAAVVGREYDLDVLAAAAGADPDTVLDDVDPAVAAGIVVEDAASGRFRFAHALVRDVVYRAQPAARRTRRHATVARVLDGTGRLSEAARHWLAAGPAHAGVAWR
ncbi:AAA family ATPase, partial [Dactylosporangium sp. NPDC005572]|uniref:AAA family ATPase n=1 Tax=Dactylosporangium sp. NPDC005572 TaxID=3156889 RepID=UPI0033BBB316